MTTSVNPPYKQLRRTTDDRVIAGVCGGLARYFDVDPVLMRVIFAVTIVFTGGLAILAYPVLWFVMPEDSRGPAAWSTPGARTWHAQTHGTTHYQPPAPPTQPTPGHQPTQPTPGPQAMPPQQGQPPHGPADPPTA